MLTLSTNLVPDGVTLQRAIARMGGLGAIMKETSLLRELAVTYRNLLEGRTPVDTGYAKSMWMYVLKGDLEAQFLNPATAKGGYCYPITLELGSEPGHRPWPNPGPRTKLASNFEGQPRIYSRQAPGGMSHPAFKNLPQDALLDGIVRQLELMLGGQK